MIVGKVMGSVVSTRKNDRLIGDKFMIVEPVAEMSNGSSQMIAVDQIGAGVGDYVLVALGSAARLGARKEDAPIDAAIVGILDEDCNKYSK